MMRERARRQAADVRHRIITLLTLAVALGSCGRLGGAAFDRAASDVAESVIRFGAEVGEMPIKSYEANGDLVAGRLFEFNGRPLLIARAEPKLMRQAAAMLDRTLVGETSILSMLDDVVDRPIVSRVALGWPKGQFDAGRYTEASLAEYMAAHRGQRVIAFGHIEGNGPAEASFVVYGTRDTQRVSVSQLLALARSHRVQLTVLGCRSYKAGAPAGPLYDIKGSDLPAMLQGMRRATTYGESIAAMGDGRQPVIVDPISLSADVATSVRAYRILGARRAIALQSTNAPVTHVDRSSDGLRSADLQSSSGVIAMASAALAVALGAFSMFYALIVPAGQIARWRRAGSATPFDPPLERLIAAVDRRVPVGDATRKLLRLLSVCAIPVLVIVVYPPAADSLLPGLVLAPVLLLNAAGWVALHLLGRGR